LARNLVKTKKGAGMKRVFLVGMAMLATMMLLGGCRGSKRPSESKSLTQQLQQLGSGLEKLSEAADEYAQNAESGGSKKPSELTSFTQQLESGLEKLSEVADEYAQYPDSDRAALAISLDVMGYGTLKPQILGEYEPKIVKSQYPLQKSETAYALFGIKVLALKASESIKASFNYTITSVEADQCSIGVEHTDFKSNSESGSLSAYYFGDWSVFGPNGPTVGQNFLAYSSYHASKIKIGIALPIIVIDGVELK
jgi:hypothetical protein